MSPRCSGVLSDFSVHGLNLADPEQAKAVIKPWDLREETSNFAESQEDIDDQVKSFPPTVNLDLIMYSDRYTCTICRECAHRLSVS